MPSALILSCPSCPSRLSDRFFRFLHFRHPLVRSAEISQHLLIVTPRRLGAAESLLGAGQTNDRQRAIRVPPKRLLESVDGVGAAASLEEQFAEKFRRG